MPAVVKLMYVFVEVELGDAGEIPEEPVMHL